MSKDIENAVIPYTKEIPVDYRATVHSIFISTYSPYEFTNWVDESMSWKTGCMIGDWSDIHKAELKDLMCCHSYRALVESKLIHLN